MPKLSKMTVRDGIRFLFYNDRLPIAEIARRTQLSEPTVRSIIRGKSEGKPYLMGVVRPMIMESLRRRFNELCMWPDDMTEELFKCDEDDLKKYSRNVLLSKRLNEEAWQGYSR